MENDRYYCCGDCAHVFSAPEHPGGCESCRYRALLVFDTLEDAEEESQSILDRSHRHA